MNIASNPSTDIKGEFLTKENRIKQMVYMKAAHFNFGSDLNERNIADDAEKEALQQKWSPQVTNVNNTRQNR